MREGLYKVEFRTPIGMGAGVVYAKNGRMWGGDAGIYYLGTYKEDGDEIAAEVAIDRHTNNPGIVSVFGVDKAEIRIKGKVKGDSIAATGTSPQAPNLTFEARLDYLSD